MHLPPLKLYSNYSLLRSTIVIPALVERAQADGVSTLALTDFATLSGAVTFRRECLKANIKPIIGLTVPVRISDTIGNIVLLAQNRTGYQSLCRISSHMQGHENRLERVARGIEPEILAANADGVIAIEGGYHGPTARLAASGRSDLIEGWLMNFGRIYPTYAYLGLDLHTQNSPSLLTHYRNATLPLAALQCAWTLEESQRDTLHLMAAIDRNIPLEQIPADALPWDGKAALPLHWQHPHAAATQFSTHPEAIANSNAIFSLCEDPLPDGTPIWPDLPLPGKHTPDSAIKQLSQNGLARIFPEDTAASAQPRLDHELSAISTHGFAPLFLIVADIVKFARKNAVPVATRGSVANSLVAYCLGITTVDPLEHDLLFERFLNPARRSLPDIDLDFCSRRRDIVLNYVRDRYGADKVALVATVNTFKRKSALREAAKAHGLPNSDIKRLVKLLPGGWHPDPRRRDKRTLEEIIGDLHDPLERRVMTAAAALIGHPHHLSLHPGGVVITPTALTDFVPLQWSPKGFRLTQYDHVDVEAVGLPKLDLLGIRALTVLADSAEYVQTHHDPDFSLENIPTDDRSTADILRTGRTVGVFQCESHGAQRTMRRLKATTIRDLAVANAFFKPGPATGGMAKVFVRRYRGEESVGYLHPKLEPILSPTRGVLLFQEQVLRVVVEVAGLDWASANQIRKGMSKFQASAMEALTEQFVQGCQREEVGMTPQQAQTLWQQVLAFAGYGFNQGHATAYADVSYRSAWMKAHYPAAFLASRLANGGGYYHPAVYIADARSLGIRVLPPHVNFSERGFVLREEPPPNLPQGERDQIPSLKERVRGTGSGSSPFGGGWEGALAPGEAGKGLLPTIYAGLHMIRDLRKSSAKAIITGRPFTSLDDLVRRVPLQQKELTHLIQAGALDEFAANRNTLLAQAAGSHGKAGQLRMEFGEGEMGPVESETAQERYDWEMNLLGFPIASDPCALQMTAPTHTPLADLDNNLGQRLSVYGYRLPSWDRDGFLIADQTSYVRAVYPRSRKDEMVKPRTWQAVLLTGTWRADRFGNHAFVIEEQT